tara:strand:- start:917 stop:2320 length:1404 start_codon:yes stop_codon:yes gene_type:complete
MKTIKQKKNYFLDSSIDYFYKYKKNRISFLKRKKKFFYEISSFVNKCVHNSKRTLFFCCGNSIVADCVKAKEKLIHEIYYSSSKKNKNEKIINNKLINSCDHIIITDTEHQKDLITNLNFIEKNLSNNSRVILVSKSLIWMTLINIFRKNILNQKSYKTNFLPFKDLKEIFFNQKFELIRNEKIIIFPFALPIINNILNTLFRLPLLNFFCMINISVFKKRTIKKKKEKISFIVPCRNEAGNIPLFRKELLNIDKNIEFLFGDDKSTDSTKKQLILLKRSLKKNKIKIYEGPGICKSKNVYKGIDLASGEIIVIYDADLTVPMSNILNAINLLNENNFDFINCTRMIYPQKYGAMKSLNFLGNIFFAKLFSILFNQRITDTLCGTKIFYKKDWSNIKKTNSKWGVMDRWGDFDLLIGAYHNNLKIVEVPIPYQERVADETKMTSLLPNTIRMIFIVVAAYIKLKVKK